MPDTYGARVLLRPVAPSNHEALQTLEAALGAHWRLQGRAVDPAQYPALLWHGALSHHLVIGRQSGQVKALCSAYNANRRAGTCWVACAALDPERNGFFAVEGLGLLVQLLLRSLWMRTIYVETRASLVARRLRRIEQFAEECGRFSARLSDGTDFEDQLVYAITRERWEHEIAPRLARQPD